MVEETTRSRSRTNSWALPPAWRFALLVFLVLRVLLSIWMWGVRQVIAGPLTPHPVLRPYLEVIPETNSWLEPWQRWDAIHYQAIAERGYQAFGGALFTPPLYPLLVRALTWLTGASSLLAGIIISNLAFLVGLVVFYQLVEMETGNDKLARRSLVYLASFPTALFFLAGYTESLFFLAAVLSLSLARRLNWVASGVWGAVAALTRLTGALLVIPLAFAAWQQNRARSTSRSWIAPALALFAVAAYPLYVWLGLKLPPWEPWLIQSARSQGGLAFPGYSLFLVLHGILSGKSVLADWWDVGCVILFLVALPAVIRRLPPIYGIYQASFLLLFLSRYSQMQSLLSTARYVLALFPAFIIFAFWGEKPWINRLFLYLSWLGLLLLSGQFAIWGWVG